VTAAANLGAIKQAELALLRSKHTEVREFAQSMLTESSAAQARQNKILAQLGIIPRDSMTSMELTQQTGMLIGGLEVTSAEAFDREYVEAQIALNRTVLGLLDSKLVPSAEQMALSEELQTMRTAVQSHLRQAEELKLLL
jgi:predicted outer membrane protein